MGDELWTAFRAETRQHLLREGVRRLLEPTPCGARLALRLGIRLGRQFRKTARSRRRWKHRAGPRGRRGKSQ